MSGKRNGATGTPGYGWGIAAGRADGPPPETDLVITEEGLAEVLAADGGDNDGVGLIPLGTAFIVSETGVEAAPGAVLTHERLDAANRIVSRVLRSIAYWAGDLANLTEQVLGEEASQILDPELFDADQLKQLRAVAERVPPANRAIAPTWAHAKAVAHLKPPAQGKYLQLALDEDWTVSKLKAEVDKAAAGGEAAVQYILVVRCKTEAEQEEVKRKLEAEGLVVTTRTSVKRAAKPKRAKRGEVTAQRKHKGAPKMYTRRRVPQ